MSSKGLHWYTNDVEELCTDKCPEGRHKGRLKVSEETRKKMSESSWIKNCSKEELSLRNAKISASIQNRTEEEKREYSKKISESRKGKGVGNIPWNKNLKGVQVPWNKGVSMSEEQKQKLRDTYNSLSDEEKERRKSAVSKAHKNKTPWNKGKTYTLDREVVALMKSKEYETKKKNNTFNCSSVEEKCFMLLDYLFKEDVVRQYQSYLYPFSCDFYIKSLDLYIEINGTWTHNNHPFSDSEEDRLILNEWKERSDSDYYKNAIYTRTDLDVRKQNYASDNKLNYISLYLTNSLDFNLSINSKYQDLVEMLYNVCKE